MAARANQTVRVTGTARFITAETAKSTLQAADGRLPELALQAGESKKRVDVQAASSNPLVMSAAIAFSIIASVVLLLFDFEGGASPSQTKNAARQKIQVKFSQNHNFGCPAKDSATAKCTCDPKPPLLEYQQLLRRAQQAYARGDLDEERLSYRRVLRLLRQENKTRYGLTGSESRDDELEELISQVLLED